MLTNVKGNGKLAWGLRGVFPPPRRRHFPTGGGCARKSEVAAHIEKPQYPYRTHIVGILYP